MQRFQQIARREFPPMFRLAAPLVFAELGWMAMGTVDTVMVGRLGPTAIAAVGVGSMWFYTVAIFGLGLLLGMDTLASQAFGAGDIDDCHRTLLHGILITIPLAPVFMAAVWAGGYALPWFGMNPGISRDALPYIAVIGWSTWPLMLYFACRRYLQAINSVKPVMFALISANIINLAANWIFIYGHFGFPAMGTAGSGWATFAARIWMFAVLAIYIYHSHRGQWRIPLRIELARIRKLLSLGWPAAVQVTVETAVFGVATVLIARLDMLSAAAHQIALNVASVTFMMPFGVSSAAAVRVGQAIGRRDPRGASESGWVAIAIGALVMTASGVMLIAAPRWIAGIYTADVRVIQVGSSLLRIAAIFQLFDGLQTVVTGALRGTGDTRTPMICHLVGYWIIGLPIGYYLCFRKGWGAAGLWAGLCVALVLIGSVLLYLWYAMIERWRNGSALPQPVPANASIV